jgi:hypothetical protein
MIMMECLGLSFLDRKVTKVVTNSASMTALFCRQISSRHNQLLISPKTYTYCLIYRLTGFIVESVLGTLSPSIM